MTEEQLKHLRELRAELDTWAKPLRDPAPLRMMVDALLDVLIDGDSVHLKLTRLEKKRGPYQRR